MALSDRLFTMLVKYDRSAQEDDVPGVTTVEDMAARIGHERRDGHDDITINL
jgi:hypothetical protein